MSMFVRGRFDVLPGKWAEFEALALTLAELAEDEPGTLTGVG